MILKCLCTNHHFQGHIDYDVSSFLNALLCTLRHSPVCIGVISVQTRKGVSYPSLIASTLRTDKYKLYQVKLYVCQKKSIGSSGHRLLGFSAPVLHIIYRH